MARVLVTGLSGFSGPYLRQALQVVRRAVQGAWDVPVVPITSVLAGQRQLGAAWERVWRRPVSTLV